MMRKLQTLSYASPVLTQKLGRPFSLGVFFLWATLTLIGQVDSLVSPVQFSGYLEVYYGYDFSAPPDHERPSFLYHHTRTDEFNVNLALIRMQYSRRNVRGNLALATGTYMHANYAAEVGVMQNLFEANLGFRASRKQSLWIEAGVFPSHIGLESAIAKDCWSLTRSLMAENSPYYESGLRVTYQDPARHWLVSGWLLNGWQQIRRQPGMRLPALGTQLLYIPNDKLTFNYSTYIGSTTPDSIRQMRYFHNMYSLIQVSEKLGLGMALDVGMQQTYSKASSFHIWYGAQILARYKLGGKWVLAGRTEYFDDTHHVVTGYRGGTLFRVYGYSFNFDFSPDSVLTWRSELRVLKGKGLFTDRKGAEVNGNVALCISIAMALE